MLITIFKGEMHILFKEDGIRRWSNLVGMALGIFFFKLNNYLDGIG